MKEWSQRIGIDVLAFHSKSKATVTRIFVFDYKTDLTEEVMAELKRQADSNKVQVYAYFHKEDNQFDFEQFSRDFCIIDEGAAISVTTVLDERGFSGVFYFNNPAQSTEYVTRFVHLKNASDTLESLSSQKISKTQTNQQQLQ